MVEYLDTVAYIAVFSGVFGDRGLFLDFVRLGWIMIAVSAQLQHVDQGWAEDFIEKSTHHEV